jgi:hypothetical protein
MRKGLHMPPQDREASIFDGLKNSFRGRNEWTEERAKEFFAACEILSRNDENNPLNDFDYFKEILFFLGVHKYIVNDLKRKFPKFAPKLWDVIRENMEVRAYQNTKRGSTPLNCGIFNLRVNYGWTEDKKPEGQSIKVEGVTTEEITELLNQGEN